MKKFYALLCLFALLSVPPAFAAYPFDVHKGGFGPKIKGLQLGMPMTIMQLKKMIRDTFSCNEFYIVIQNINGLSEDKNDLILDYRKNEDGEMFYYHRKRGAYKSFENKRDNVIFDEIEKRGYGYVEAADGAYDDKNPYVTINIRHNRVSYFNLKARVFGAGSMSFEEFLQALQNAYPLPPLEVTKYPSGEKVLRGYNRPEGWLVYIDYDKFIGVETTDVATFD